MPNLSNLPIDHYYLTYHKTSSNKNYIYDYKDLADDDDSRVPKNFGKVAVPCIYYVDECESLMCLPCSAEDVSLPSGLRLPGVCPTCELDRLDDMEKLGLYYQEEGSRKMLGQLWAQAFRVSGTDTFDGMCTAAIFEHLDKMDKRKKEDE